MGGKRPDQYNIDPAEGSSTDHKWRGEGRSRDEQLSNEEKQHLQSNPHDQPMIPESGVNPVAREVRERKMHRHDENQGLSAGSGRSDDDRVDEASRESFPASDPPAQP